MKKVALLITLAFGIFSASAQKPAYEKTMTDLVSKIQQTQFNESLQPLTNKMDRIAAAETEEWLPAYWVAYGQAMESFRKQDSGEKDQLLELAEKSLAKAEAISPENDEIEVLKAQIASARLSVDPMNRFQTYGPKFGSALALAEKINPTNPRVVYLKAMNAFYTPENFGGGKAIAKPLFEQAIDKYSKFEQKSVIHPSWGKMESEYFLSQCQ
ncbi:hypothetical protein [Arcticibacterium luteifluviistationis]|uniref:Uncharacterized protein n=1 Tax=Arcticibacterium luteifluviistationis TaxID=1784714 RepID=A0A2Z4G9D4_9BACT|nr:hypothetical protein [Arcticibacterium luteifluviistationis]AWV97821.1 hypothetical protein DJ013_06420 [Arcticibacterium luteifluviistationis]